MHTSHDGSLAARQTVFSRYTAIDLLVVSYLSLLLLLVSLFSYRFESPWEIFDRLLVSLGGYAALWVVMRRCSEHVRATLRIAMLAVLLMYLFDEMQYFQHLLFSSWLDDIVLGVEASIFGGNVVRMLESVVHPYVTEGLMFTYVLYMPLLPLLAGFLYVVGGDKALSDYLLNISMIFLFCYAGYVLFPVASPMHFSPSSYATPLEGGLFTWCGEWLRHNQHYPGGSVPSAHCAAATGMLIMLRRYYRNGYYVCIPIFSLLYAATVYGRYHYLTDAVAGICVALIVVRVSPLVAGVVDGSLAVAHKFRTSFGFPNIPQPEKTAFLASIERKQRSETDDTFLTKVGSIDDSSGRGAA